MKQPGNPYTEKYVDEDTWNLFKMVFSELKKQ